MGLGLWGEGAAVAPPRSRCRGGSRCPSPACAAFPDLVLLCDKRSPVRARGRAFTAPCGALERGPQAGGTSWSRGGLRDFRGGLGSNGAARAAGTEEGALFAGWG